MIKERRRDPKGDHEYYKKGPKNGTVRKEVKTSLSVLYARQAARSAPAMLYDAVWACVTAVTL